MHLKTISRMWAISTLTIAVVLGFSALGLAQAYKQTNLDSDIQGLAQNPPSGQPDTQLVNPWGLIASPTSPWWLSDNNAGVSTLDDGQGVKQGLVVNIPSPVTGVAGTPTGVVFTGAAGFTFHAKNAQGQDTTTGAVFTFVTEDGTIVAWGPGINPTDLPNDAFVVVDKSKTPSANEGAVYKGATIAQTKTGGPFFLYVANFRSGRIEVYDTKFKRVELDDADNDHGDQAFTDRKSGFAPFNVQEVSGNLYVTYAKQNASKRDDFDFPGLGIRGQILSCRQAATEIGAGAVAQCALRGCDRTGEFRVLQQPAAHRQCRERTDCCLRRRQRAFRWPTPRCKWTCTTKRSPVGATLWQRPGCWTDQLAVLHRRHQRRGARSFRLLHACG